MLSSNADNTSAGDETTSSNKWDLYGALRLDQKKPSIGINDFTEAEATVTGDDVSSIRITSEDLDKMHGSEIQTYDAMTLHTILGRAEPEDIAGIIVKSSENGPAKLNPEFVDAIRGNYSVLR